MDGLDATLTKKDRCLLRCASSFCEQVFDPTAGECCCEAVVVAADVVNVVVMATKRMWSTQLRDEKRVEQDFREFAKGHHHARRSKMLIP